MLERPRTHNLLILKTGWFGEFQFGAEGVWEPWGASGLQLTLEGWRICAPVSVKDGHGSSSRTGASIRKYENGRWTQRFLSLGAFCVWVATGRCCRLESRVCPYSVKPFWTSPPRLPQRFDLIPGPIKLRTKVNYHQVCLSLGMGVCGVHILAVFLRGQMGLSAALFTSIKIHFTQKDRW